MTKRITRFLTIALSTLIVLLGMSFSVMAEEIDSTEIMQKMIVVYNMDEKVDENGVSYYPIHVYAAIDNLKYQEVGMTMTVSSISGVKQPATKTFSTKKVYSSMKWTNSKGEETRYTPDQLGGAYLFGHEMLFTATNWVGTDVKITVTPYAINKAGDTIRGKTIEVTDEAIKERDPSSGLFRQIEKFEVGSLSEADAESTVTLGQLFNAVEGVEIDSSLVTVTVSENVTYAANTEDWTQSTVTFDKVGSATVTIKEGNNLSTTATVEVNPIDKFTVALENTSKYLYRVGNANTVALGYLFEGTNVDSATFEASAVCTSGNASAVFTANTTDWTNATLKFTGTGVAEITVKDANSNPVTLTVEIVNATNVTSYSGLGNRSSVLLDNITMTSGGKYYMSNATLYGNGFTFDVTAGKDSDTEGGSVSENGTVCITDAVLDNIKIIGEVYTEYGGAVKSEYNFPTVLVLGDSVIANSYISNGCSPVRVGSGCNIEVINTTLDGGIFANMDIRGGTVKLEDVTTINQSTTDGQALTNDKGVVGLGIVIYTGSTVTLDIDGLTQYNCVSKNTEFKSSDANTLKTVIFSSNYSQYQFSYENVTWVNTGILSMVEEVTEDNFTALDGYSGQEASISSFTGYVYAPSTLTSVAVPSAYVSSAQYHVAPTYSFDYTTKNNVPQVSGSNDYCVYESATGKYLVSFDLGESFVFDADILTVTKEGEELEVSASVSDGATVNSDNTIEFTTAGDYVITYSYTDGENYRLNNGEIEKYSVTYQKKVRITVYAVEDTSAKTEFAFGSNGFRTETANNLTYVMPDVNATVDSNTNGIGVTTVGGVNIYYPIVSMHKSGSSSWYNYFSVFEAVTITDLNGDVHSTSSTELPSGLTVVGGFILDVDGNVSTAESANGTGIFNYETGKEIKCATYSSYGLCYYPDSQFTPTGTSSRAEQTIVAKYRYTDSNGTPYYYYVGYWCEKHTKTEICFTPDTLITLADGSQKRVDEVTFEDRILAYDFFTGEYVQKNISLLVNHGEGFYEVSNLEFSDGTVLKTIGEHGVFDYDDNKFAYITPESFDYYIGHSFVKSGDNGEYETVTLVNAFVTEEYTSAYSITSAGTSNAFASGMLTVAPPEDFYNWIEMKDKLLYDSEQFAKDVETYGLYTYEDFADYVSYETFVNFNGAYLKIPVEKGIFTFEYILELIETYSQWMPEL